MHLKTFSSRNTVGRGFSLVEILVVVLILAILAAIVVPQFTSAADESRDNSLRMNLYRIRQQLEVYKQQHGNWPALDSLSDQLTLASNEKGETAAIGTEGYPLGPYLQTIPSNPYSRGRTVSSDEPGSSDWYYNEETGEFAANDSEAHRTY